MTNTTIRLVFVACCLIGLLAGGAIVMSKTTDKENSDTTEQALDLSSPKKASTTIDSSDTDKPKDRGLMLYENHCRVCHESNVHIRNNRKAKSKSDISYWATRWSTHLDLKWKKQDLVDVVDHINNTYYHYSD
jgi:cytochrome c5